MNATVGAVALGATALTLALSSMASAGPSDATGTTSRHASAAVSVANSAAAPEAGSSTTIGQAATDTTASGCPPLSGVQQSVGGQPGYTTPSAGVVTRLSYNANEFGGQIRALFWKPSATPGSWTLVAKSALATITPSTLNTIATRFPVPAGAFMGLQTTVLYMNCAGTGVAGDAVQLSATFNPDTSSEMTTTGSAPGRRWNLSAVLESDADGDGYGDVTQDLCPTQAETHGDCPDRLAPETTITKVTAKKVTSSGHKKTARVTVAFGASEPATFVCSIDGAAYSTCQSPLVVKLKRGIHDLKVRAIDAAGNVDSTPASATVKVKKAKTPKKPR
jgi:hypothetical protein